MDKSLKIDIDNWKRKMIETAKSNYETDKMLVPVALLYTENKDMFIKPMPFKDNRQRDLYYDIVKQSIREHRAIAVLVIQEGYMINFSNEETHKILKEDGTPIKPIKDMSGNKEAIVILFETKNGESEIITIEIVDQKIGEEKTRSPKDGSVNGLSPNFFTTTPKWVN